MSTRFVLRQITAAFGFALAAVMLLISGTARAQIGSERYSSIVIDAGSGNVLSASNPDVRHFPASLTKMMTIYLVFEAIRDRRVALNQFVPVSPAAAAMPPTKLGIVPGGLITVEQAILGLVTKSANDAAAALGEMLGGDEDRFAQMMTVRAHALGMTQTVFRNASGLPDWEQVSTARDMAVLARHLIQDFPGFYHYFSTPSFVYAGRFIPSHQHLLTTYPGADGLKTGYTDAAGYNVVTSAVHSDTRLIGVVIGAGNGGERDAHMAMLLDQGFDRMGVPPVAGPVLVSRRDPGSRFPSLINMARAAPSPPGYALRPPQTSQVSIPTLRRPPMTRPERAPRLTYGSSPVQMRSASMQVQMVHRSGPTRTAHGSYYPRYPG